MKQVIALVDLFQLDLPIALPALVQLLQSLSHLYYLSVALALCNGRVLPTWCFSLLRLFGLFPHIWCVLRRQTTEGTLMYLISFISLYSRIQRSRSVVLHSLV